MKLHYSQTNVYCRINIIKGFTTLWNYTTLKPLNSSSPLMITFYYLMKLHYSQTICSVCFGLPLFYYLMKLHYSQTYLSTSCHFYMFYYLMKLHYSQTSLIHRNYKLSFTTLWNYTTLKPVAAALVSLFRFTTLWNYTTLKPQMKVNGEHYKSPGISKAKYIICYFYLIFNNFTHILIDNICYFILKWIENLFVFNNKYFNALIC